MQTIEIWRTMNRIYVQNNCTYEALASYHTLLKIHIFHKKSTFCLKCSSLYKYIYHHSSTWFIFSKEEGIFCCFNITCCIRRCRDVERQSNINKNKRNRRMLQILLLAENIQNRGLQLCDCCQRIPDSFTYTQNKCKNFFYIPMTEE